MKISAIGTGYVGLVTAACLAELGNDVACIDINQEKIKMLKNGRIPIYEPGLEDMVQRNYSNGRLSFSAKLKHATDAEIAFITVGTPPREDGNPDMSSTYAAAKTIGQYIHSPLVIVTKSTVPVGTAQEIKKIVNQELARRKKKVDYAVVSNPEFLREGSAIEDFAKPARIVLGTNSGWAIKKMKELYEPFKKQGCSILVMDHESAEMTKYAANAMLACKISFINQIANICEKVGADVEKVREGASLDPRIGKHFLYPGVGYGGSCFPKDVQALIALAKKIGYRADLLEAIETVNYQQKDILAKKVLKKFKEINGKTFAIWGMAFKPGTDDVREAPFINITEMLLAKGAKITAYDPQAVKEIKKIFQNRIEYGKDIYATCKNADALLVVTEWPEFREPNFDKIKKILKSPIIFDGRNIYNGTKLKKMGFAYFGIGK